MLNDPHSGRPEQLTGWRLKLHVIIFEADTPLGRAFDITLIAAICLSVATVILESVASIRTSWGPQLRAAEWFFTALFTVEYVLRLMSVRMPTKYAKSFFGVIDLLSVLPTYLTLFASGGQVFLVVRVLRLLRLFRVLKMARYVSEVKFFVAAIRAAGPKITVFLLFVLSTVTVVGALMHLIEGGVNPGFSSIPQAVYWAIVTVTTVGFGDITPITPAGKVLASMLMLVGYGTIAIPTGIFSVELARSTRTLSVSTQACPMCSAQGHDEGAKFCRSCGAELNPAPISEAASIGRG